MSTGSRVPVDVKLLPGGAITWRYGVGAFSFGATYEVRDWTGAHLPEIVVGAELDQHDLVALDSVEPHGDGLIFSARNLDAVYRGDRTTAAIDWKLGGTPKAESLAVLDDDRPQTLSAQHDARLGTGGELTVFDKGSSVPDRTPRVVRIRIDADRRVAQVVGTIEDASGPPSGCCGGSRPVPGGGMAISWGGMLQGVNGEADAAGTPLIRITADGGFTYRFEPIAPGILAAAVLRAGMDSMHG